ncbi:MAG TPA: ACT domain-containing protein [Gemmataceae bacterium]|nr:ACT domain-containing protein [Gemmataceae bacterium]
MQTSKQITVFLENKPGRLANVLAALASDKVNITALSVMDKHEHSVLRLVTDDSAKTMRIIQAINTPFTETEVLVVELKNQPGALSHVCEVLAQEHINIDYAYCSSGGRNGQVVGIFKLSNAEKAIRVLGQSPNSSARRLEKRVLRDQRSYAPKGNNTRR